jgi:NAD(P)-dependent dehydrogenase (short-subunit alcohol dehydrogenase family)
MIQRSVLITGCSSGIGLASARLLKARGWRVLATARRAQDLGMLEREVGVEALALELSDPASVAACSEEALGRTGGRLYALFNNAAYGQVGAVEDLSPDALRRQLEVNVVGALGLVRPLVAAMRKAVGGRIVVCSSVLGFMAAPYRGAYCASKFAVEALADALRLELQGTHIRVSIIEPGPIRTRFVERALQNFKATIDVENSPHRETYMARLAVMEAGGRSAFKLEPEAVAWKLVHALESPRPKARYLVTLPTYATAFVRRFLPGAASDWMARRV